MEKQHTVLLAEDDLQLGFLIKESLEDEGYEVINCPDGEVAWELYLKRSPDICLLDINMPLRDGLSLARKIRQKSDVVPILFLTAKSMEEDRIRGFEGGADDYITKPFNMAELLLRMKVFLRRTNMLLQQKEKTYPVGSMHFVPHENRLLREGGETLLTAKESQLLLFFCNHPNRVIKREEILIHVWGKNDYFLGRSMDVFITRLRKHLKPEPLVSLETIPHTGFRLHLP